MALFNIAAISGTIATIAITKHLHSNALRFIGRNSLLYYCLLFLLLLPTRYITTFIPCKNPIAEFIVTTMQAVIILIVLVPVIKFINNRLPWLTGKTAK